MPKGKRRPKDTPYKDKWHAVWPVKEFFEESGLSRSYVGKQVDVTSSNIYLWGDKNSTSFVMFKAVMALATIEIAAKYSAKVVVHEGRRTSYGDGVKALARRYDEWFPEQRFPIENGGWLKQEEGPLAAAPVELPEPPVEALPEPALPVRETQELNTPFGMMSISFDAANGPNAVEDVLLALAERLRVDRDTAYREAAHFKARFDERDTAYKLLQKQVQVLQDEVKVYEALVNETQSDIRPVTPLAAAAVAQAKEKIQHRPALLEVLDRLPKTQAPFA